MHRHGTMARIRQRHLLILGVDHDGDSADFCCCHEAAPTGCGQQLATQTLALQLVFDGESCKPKTRYVMAVQTTPDDLRCPIAIN